MNENINNLKETLKNSIKNISKNDNQPSFEKEELIIQKLEVKLGKPKDEIRNMLSDGLLKLLAKVPFKA